MRHYPQPGLDPADNFLVQLQPQKLEPGGELLLRQLQLLSPLPDPLAGDIAQTIMLV